MKRRGTVHVGVSSLLLIFLVLSLVSFAVLSLANATADLKRARRYAERTTGYYEACAMAQEFIAEVENALQTSSDALTDEIRAKDFPVSKTRYLHVELAPETGDDATGTPPGITVTSWQLITDENAYTLDESLPVFP